MRELWWGIGGVLVIGLGAWCCIVGDRRLGVGELVVLEVSLWWSRGVVWLDGLGAWCSVLCWGVVGVWLDSLGAW